MGVIQRQTFKNNLVSYLAVFVGLLAQLFLYTENMALKGNVDAMLKTVFLLGPFIGFGVQSVMVRFLPYLDEDKLPASQRLLTRGLLLVTINLAILSLGNVLFGEMLNQYFQQKSINTGLFGTDRWRIVLLLAPFVYSILITTHVLNFQRIAVPAIFNNLLPKLLLPACFSLAIFGYVTEQVFTNLFIGIYWVVLLGLLIYAYVLGILRLRWGKLKLSGKTRHDMFSLGAFTLLSGLGSALAVYLDTLFVYGYIGPEYTNIYSFCIFVTAVMAIPFRAVNGIASPIISKAWKEKDSDQMGMLYRETATVLYTAAGFIFAGAIVCLPYVYGLSENTSKLAPGFIAVVILGIGQLIDQATSINGTLITYSDNYRWNVGFIVVLGALNMVMNYYFMAILQLGLVGAAAATLISLLIYNIMKVAFVYSRMRIHPFSFSLLNATGLILLAILVGWYIPCPSNNAMANIALRGGVITAVFYLLLRYTKLVPTVNGILHKGVKQVLGW